MMKFRQNSAACKAVLSLATSALCLSVTFAQANDRFGSFMPMDKIANPAEFAKHKADPNREPVFPVIIEYKVPEPNDDGEESVASTGAAFPDRNAAVRNALVARVMGGSRGESGPQSVSQIDGAVHSPHLFMNLTQSQISAFASDPEVVTIQYDEDSFPALDQSAPYSGAASLWSRRSYGTGRTAVVLDTGIKYNHEFIGNARIVAAACYNTNDTNGMSSRCPGGVTESTSRTSAADCLNGELRGCGHGTHVAGIILGYNTARSTGEPRVGMAYRGNLIPMNVFSRVTNSSRCGGASRTPCVLSRTSDQIKALDRVYALRNTYNIDVVNMSLGGSTTYDLDCDWDTRAAIINKLKDAGIAVVVSAGNSGQDDRVSRPACINASISVGATGNNNTTRASYSNWGRMVDIAAPGSNINSSEPGNTAGSTSSYASRSGTSMAAPHVAGAILLLREFFPNASVDVIQNALMSNITKSTSAGTSISMLNVYQACLNLGNPTCAKVTAPSNGPLFASVLPMARGIELGKQATAFATIINAGTTTARSCRPVSTDPNTRGISYQTVNSANQLTGSANRPATIPAGGSQGFVFSVDPIKLVNSRLVPIVFDCMNTTAAAASVPGLNQFQYSVGGGGGGILADVIPIIQSASNNGYIQLASNTATSFAAVAAVNIGQTVTRMRVNTTQVANLGQNPNMPITVDFCVSNPSNGQCLTPYSVTRDVAWTKDEVKTFVVRVRSTGRVADNPSLNRVHMYFTDRNNVIGSTSIGVRTGN